MAGRLAGQIVVAFEDTSGLALADLLLNQPRGTAAEWGEMETSAVLETTTILGCAYLNSLARTLPVDDGAMSELLPSPPRFSRDFAQSLIEFTLMDQIVVSTHVLLARIEFRIDGEPVDWTVLLVPDAASMLNLRELLSGASILRFAWDSWPWPGTTVSCAPGSTGGSPGKRPIGDGETCRH